VFTIGFFLAKATKSTDITRRAEDYTDSRINRKEHCEDLWLIKYGSVTGQGEDDPSGILKYFAIINDEVHEKV
jgi:hypothetical protein